MTDLYVAKIPDKTILDMLAELKEKYGSSHIGIASNEFEEVGLSV